MIFHKCCDCSAAGSWLFLGRKWLNPLDPNDRTMLDIHYQNLCALCPSFTSCPKKLFLDSLSYVSSSWSRRMEGSGKSLDCEGEFVKSTQSLKLEPNTTETPEDFSMREVSFYFPETLVIEWRCFLLLTRGGTECLLAHRNVTPGRLPA